MQKQGKILRDCKNGSGLISSQGEKWEFTLETHWKSDSIPYVGSGVNFVVDDNNQLVSIFAIDPRAEAEQKLKELGEKFKTDGLPIAQNFWQNLRARVGIPRLVLFVLLLISWYGFDAIVAKRFSATFFDLLALFNNKSLSGNSGIYGFGAWLSLFAILLPIVWKDRKAYLGALFPLVIYLLGILGAWLDIQLIANAWGYFYNKPEISLGFGFYVSLLLSLALAGLAVWDYLTRPA
ncbi:MAG: hypothetical protein LBU53_08400 [Zoogloeaceae bacterium]|jgi:hypothetical protein|nr:hypothetical protein [Zoogloeaceae bacterium]